MGNDLEGMGSLWPGLEDQAAKVLDLLPPPLLQAGALLLPHPWVSPAHR